MRAPFPVAWNHFRSRRRKEVELPASGVGRSHPLRFIARHARFFHVIQAIIAARLKRENAFAPDLLSEVDVEDGTRGPELTFHVGTAQHSYQFFRVGGPKLGLCVRQFCRVSAGWALGHVLALGAAGSATGYQGTLSVGPVGYAMRPCFR